MIIDENFTILYLFDCLFEWTPLETVVKQDWLHMSEKDMLNIHRNFIFLDYYYYVDGVAGRDVNCSVGL